MHIGGFVVGGDCGNNYFAGFWSSHIFMQLLKACTSNNSALFYLGTPFCFPYFVETTDQRAFLKVSLSRRGQNDSYRNMCRSAYSAQSLPPLTKEEEYRYFADVQDLIALEKKKADLEVKLGRASSYQEWADHVGCSICRLYARIGKGRAAKRKMIAANLSMLSSIAKEFHGHGLSHQELCQEGARGLVKSTEKFDVSHKAKFSTYSYYWIRERMFAAVQKFQSILMDGRSLRRRVAFILSCKEEFHKIKGRNPSIDELSTISNIDIIKIRQTFFSVRSVRRPVESKYNDKHTGWEQIQGPESQSPWRGIWHNELKMELQVLFRTLSPRELQRLGFLSLRRMGKGLLAHRYEQSNIGPMKCSSDNFSSVRRWVYCSCS
ncbi:hypothetical protein KP509_23G063000 [Ceratopteris richardii]|uniref:RNA polymerase sigma-70 region 2 domain-containing protein n=1 Tax=Ceratopteris richardii TaxID=49495 RepID=A0A8T2S0K2_CERRI|nr:hypothetical protein KP509_23G063000 [Ceratopteris richardii]